MYALEDQLFAEYLRDHLGDSQPTTIEMIKDRLSQHEWLKTSFLDPNNHNFPEDDFHLSLEIDVFDFFPVVQEGKIIKSTQL